MLLSKNSKLNKRFFDLIQFMVLGALFALVLNREIVVFIKNFIDSLPVGSDFIRSIAVECYLGLKAIIHGPSLMAVLLVCLQLFYITYDLYYILNQDYAWVEDANNCEEVIVTTIPACEVSTNKRYCYLKLSRLLF